MSENAIFVPRSVLELASPDPWHKRPIEFIDIFVFVVANDEPAHRKPLVQHLRYILRTMSGRKEKQQRGRRTEMGCGRPLYEEIEPIETMRPKSAM